MTSITLTNPVITIDGDKMTITLTPEQKADVEKLKEWPQKGDEYFWISSCGDVGLAHWNNDDIDRDRQSIGNVYRTREEAEAEAEKRKALATIKKFIRENGMEWEPDWEDEDQRKSRPMYNHKTARFKPVENTWSEAYSPFGHLRTNEDCEKLIAACEAELRTLWGIKG